MNARRPILSALLAVLCTLIVLAAVLENKIRAAPPAPASLVGHTWVLAESTNESVMRFFSNSRYEINSLTETETGFYTPALNGNSWKVVATKSDGSITRQYTFTFTTPSSAAVTILVAGERPVSGTIRESTVPLAPLSSMNVTNEASLAGPSYYKIDFTGNLTGVFKLSFPGYGSGTYRYTPNPIAAKLVLTYTNADIAGDIDDLTLRFNGASGSPVLSEHAGAQTVRGVSTNISGTFTFNVQ